MQTTETDRSLYLWAGRGARRILRSRFPGITVDDPAYDMAYTEEGVARVRAMGFNRVYLMSGWGFPPEAETTDREAFRRAVRYYHQAGIRVCGGVQSAACAAEGSYRGRSWYALDPWGKRIPYAVGRYYTCLSDSGWLAEVQQRVREVVETGADGVFLSAAWMGTIPLGAGRSVWGTAGCHDVRCRAAYAEAADGQPVPKGLNRHDPAVQRYLRWYADLTARRLAEWIEFARGLKSGLLIALEDSSPSRVSYRSPLLELAAAYDVLLLRGSLPRVASDALLIQNATGLGGVRSEISTPLVLSQTGPDEPASMRRVVVAMVEACAMHTPPVVDGSGLVDQGKLAPLIHQRYEQPQQTVRQINDWRHKHAAWLSDRVPASPLAVYCPHALLSVDDEVASLFEAVCQTILRRGYPFRVVGAGEWPDVQTVIVPPGPIEGLDRRLSQFAEGGGRVIALQRTRPGSVGRPVWVGYHPARSSWLYWPLIRRITYRAGVLSWRWYYTRRWVRFLTKQVRRSKVAAARGEALPPPDLQAELVEAVGTDFKPYAEVEGACLFTIWREPDGHEQWHIVNYLDKPQRITIHAPQFVNAYIQTLGDGGTRVFGNELIVTVSDYKVLRIRRENAGV